MASSTLRRIARAQEEFREKDLDGNGAADYWRKDIAGLCGKGPLYEAVAEADDRPDTETSGARRPWGGFWVRAIRLPGETALSPDRFAACCFPARYGPGIRGHYVIREDGIVYKKDLGHGRGIDTYPLDPAGEGWERVK